MLKKIGLSLGIASLLLVGSLGALIANAQSGTAGEGASFNEVWNVITNAPSPDPSNGEVAEYGTAAEPKLPHYSSNFDVLTSIATGAMKAAAMRTINNHEDYHDYFKKLVHANGTCFAGVWNIMENSPYTGLFANGQSALIIGRLSSATPTTTKDGKRAFGFAGKIFPTMDPGEVVKTANFFTVDNLNGTNAQHFLDVSLVNEPPVDLTGVINPLRTLNQIFALADVHPTFRPLYPIAHAGQAAGAPARAPHWMRLRIAPSNQNPAVNDADFRDELSAKNYPDGLVFLIEGSDITKDASSDTGWQSLGEIRTSAMVTSFGCDRRLHFSHPPFADPELRNP